MKKLFLVTALISLLPLSEAMAEKIFVEVRITPEDAAKDVMVKLTGTMGALIGEFEEGGRKKTYPYGQEAEINKLNLTSDDNTVHQACYEMNPGHPIKTVSTNTVTLRDSYHYLLTIDYDKDAPRPSGYKVGGKCTATWQELEEKKI